MGRRSSPKQLLLSVNQLSESLGLDRATITKRLNAARVEFEPGPRRAKLYRLSDAVRACLVDFLGADQPGSYEEAKTREMKARAQLQELDLALKRGQVVMRADCEKAWSEYIARANARLGSLPTRLAPMLLGKEDEAEVKALLDDAIDEVRAELQRDAGSADEGSDEVDADSEADGE